MDEYVYSLDLVVDHLFVFNQYFISYFPTTISDPVDHQPVAIQPVSFSVLCVSVILDSQENAACVLGLGFVKYMKWVVPCWKPVTVLDDYFNSLYIILRGSVSCGNSSSRLSLCNFDHYSFIFCEPGTGGKLLHSMIYDIPSQQCMKNKLDFPTPFPHQHPITTTTITALPAPYHTCLSPVCTWQLSS